MDRQLRDECAKQLRSRREEWSRRLAAIEADRRRESGALSADFEEQVTQRENDETLDALDERGYRALEAIDAALARIEAGSFGECVRCGEEIDAGRLRAEPSAAACIECANGASPG